MQHLRFGRFEFLQIRDGELMLDPWPTTMRDVKFGPGDVAAHKPLPAEFDLKAQVADFFEYVRAVDTGEIRCLSVRNGLPWTMEVAHQLEPNGGCGNA
jgi:hypothetical protein